MKTPSISFRTEALTAALVLCSGLSAPVEAAASRKVVSAPAPAPQAEVVPAAESGAFSRFASGTKKLATFWRKEDANAAGAAVGSVGTGKKAASAPQAVKSAAQKPAAQKAAAKKPAAPDSTARAAAARPEAPAATSGSTTSRFKSLLTFWKKSETAPATAAAAPTKAVTQPAPLSARVAKTASPAKAAEQKVAAKPASKPAPQPAPVVAEAKKPGVFSRMLSVFGGGSTEVAAEKVPAPVAKAGAPKPVEQKLVAKAAPKPAVQPAAQAVEVKKAGMFTKVLSVFGGGASDAAVAKASAGSPAKMAKSDGAPKKVEVRAALDYPAEKLGEDLFVITKDETPFYTFGPQQAMRPDTYLRTGSVVTMLKKSWGWAEVKLADGRVGTIDRGATRLAVAQDLVPKNVPAAPGAPKKTMLASAGPVSKPVPAEFILPAAPLPDLPMADTAKLQSVDNEVLSNSLLPPLDR